MHYLSAITLNIKLKQDDSDFSQELQSIIICDGIGGMEGSERVSKIIAENLIPDNNDSSPFPIEKNTTFLRIQEANLAGGTTVIHLSVKEEKAIINYIGNGGAIHLHGDFAKKKYADNYYQYAQLLTPHINSNGALTRYVSIQASSEQLLSSETTISLNNSAGDIILLYSDGINSLEVNPIIKDEENRFWRNESEAIHFILENLDKWLQTLNSQSNLEELLPEFIEITLDALNTQNMLEDDASLGILISDKVLDHYLNQRND
jgi:serine/threonine protein phosphatase PrpC